jgi:hypothetical protein
MSRSGSAPVSVEACPLRPTAGTPCRAFVFCPCLTGVAAVTKRSGKTCVVIMRYGAHARLRNTVITGPALRFNTIRSAAVVTLHCPSAAALTGVLSAVLQTDCSMSPAFCSRGKRYLIPLMVSRSQPSGRLLRCLIRPAWQAASCVIAVGNLLCVSLFGWRAVSSLFNCL